MHEINYSIELIPKANRQTHICLYCDGHFFMPSTPYIRVLLPLERKNDNQIMKLSPKNGSIRKKTQQFISVSVSVLPRFICRDLVIG